MFVHYAQVSFQLCINYANNQLYGWEFVPQLPTTALALERVKFYWHSVQLVFHAVISCMHGCSANAMKDSTESLGIRSRLCQCL